MQLIFGPRVDIQHLMCPLANNWPPHYAPHYCSWSLAKRWIFNILVSCQQLASSILCTSLLCNWSLVQVDIQHLMSSCQWPPQYYAPHYYAADLWSKVDIQHFNVSSCQQLASSILCTSLLCSWSLVQEWIFNILMCLSCQQLASSILCTSYYATVFGPKVDIQHFNVSSCQQLASSILCTSLLCNWSLVPRWIFNILMCPLANNWPPSNTMPHCCSWSFQRWIFNILMCPLANNWPPQYYAPHYYATDLWSQGGLFNILMCPLANNWPPQYYASLLCNDLWSKVDIQHFNVSSCQQLASQYYAPHYYATDLWSKVDIQHFNVSSCQQLASSILCTSLLCSWSFGPGGCSTFKCVLLPTTGLLNTIHLLLLCSWSLSKVDIQHFNVSSCQQLASSILCLTTMQLIFWSKVDIQHFNVSSCQQLASLSYASLLCSWSLVQRWIFNILMCLLPTTGLPSILCTSLLCSWSLVQGGYSTFYVSSCQQLASSVLCTSLLYAIFWSKGGYSTF
jgi:hypothetical protein